MTKRQSFLKGESDITVPWLGQKHDAFKKNKIPLLVYLGLPSRKRVDLLQLILKSIQLHLSQCKMKEETEDVCSKTVKVIFDSVFLPVVRDLMT